MDLIKRAGTDGVLDDAWVERLDAGRRLRNDLVHQRTATVWSPAMSADIVRASHEAVAAIFRGDTT